KTCNIEILYGRTYCKECYKNRITPLDISHKTIGEIKSESDCIVTNKSKIRKDSKQILKYKNICKKCFTCDFNRHLEICHIKPLKEFKDSSTLAEVNDI